jgi:hypothetical protein
MNRVNIDLGPTPNRSRDPEVKPTWAQLTRLGGDRVAILFEDLRRRIGVIDGLIEDLYFAGCEEGWVPRYRLGGETVALIRISSRRLAGVLCAGIAGERAGSEKARVRLSSHASVSKFARQIILC